MAYTRLKGYAKVRCCLAKDEDPQKKVLKFLQEHEGELVRITDIAAATGLTWSQVLRELTYLIFDYITAKHPEILKELPVKPEKKWDSWLFVPQAVEEVA